MSRTRVIGAVAALIAIAVVVYFATRPAQEVPTPPAQNALTPVQSALRLDSVEFTGPAGRQVAPLRDRGFTLPDPSRLRGDATVTGTQNPSGNLTVTLLSHNPAEGVDKTICDLPVERTGATSFRILVPKARLEAGRVYRIMLTSEASGLKELYGFNVTNRIAP